MQITQTIDFLKSLKSKTDKKHEVKLYNLFIDVLESLIGMDLSDEIMQSISEKLEQLQLDSTQENHYKYIKKQYIAFTAYLEKEHKLIEKGRYLGLGMSFGMVFGLIIALTVRFDYGMQNETTGGLIVGMLVGMFIGYLIDKKAKDENRVLIKK